MESLLIISAVFLCFAAWLTNVYVCLKNNKWGILIAGILMLPIAIVHGMGIWFGKFSISPMS